jgi:hypothetical protein
MLILEPDLNTTIFHSHHDGHPLQYNLILRRFQPIMNKPKRSRPVSRKYFTAHSQIQRQGLELQTQFEYTRMELELPRFIAGIRPSLQLFFA